MPDCGRHLEIVKVDFVDPFDTVWTVLSGCLSVAVTERELDSRKTYRKVLRVMTLCPVVLSVLQILRHEEPKKDES